ncbi:MAG: isoprenyl transferase [Acidobacteria bacterium]|nr:MAG: isoprenyl transferase [Acidobacteriota bacterium]
MSDLLKRFEGFLEPSSREWQLLTQLDPSKLPQHIAVIMDGNGRWAQCRRLPRVAGHREGSKAVRAVIETSARLTIPVLTLYAFSAENWKRPATEVGTLMSLLEEYLRKELHTLQENQISFRAIGRILELPSSVQRELRDVETATAGNGGMKLVIALNYSGRLEIIDAINRIVEKGSQSPVTERDLSENLYTAGFPDPDLMIRTSGEMRISNFLLWQIAYSEIYVTDVLWPDFRPFNLLEAVLNFQRRERRYGGIRAASVVNTR